jgi:hypothetical protein
MSAQQPSRNSAYSSTASSPHQYCHYDYDAPAQSQAQWMKVIPIEDDELTFGGKPLSDWHEEDLRRYSGSSFDSDEQQHRGRTRSRSYYEPAAPASSTAAAGHHGHVHVYHKYGHAHHHHHHHHHHMSDKKK